MGPFYRPHRREGKTFSTLAECATAWARGSYSEGRVGRDRMYFRGNTIYSNRDNWPLAKIEHNFHGVAYVLVNVERISVSTSNHLRHVRDAIRQFFGEAHTVFEMDTNAIIGRRSDVYKYYSENLSTALAAAGKARGRLPVYLDAAHHAVSEGNRFASVFGDPVPFPTNPSEALALALHDSTREAA